MKRNNETCLDDELCRAAACGDFGDVATLLERGAAAGAATEKNGWTALHYACTCPDDGGAATIKLLAARGARVDVRCANGSTPCARAAFKGHVACLAALLSLGADSCAVNAAGSTPLHAAASRGRAACCALLLKHRADPSARNCDGETPADRCRAARRGDVAAATLAALGEPGYPLAAPEEEAGAPAAFSASADVRWVKGRPVAPAPEEGAPG